MRFIVVVKDGPTEVANIDLPVQAHVATTAIPAEQMRAALDIERAVEILTGYRCHVTVDTRTDEQRNRPATRPPTPPPPIDPDLSSV